MRRVLSYAAVGFAVVVLAPLFLLIVTGTLKAYAIPSSAMEPTLHCAQPAPGCEGDAKDRITVWTRFVSYGRGDIVAFETPPAAKAKCGAGGTFVKRIIGLPGEQVDVRLQGGAAHVYVDGVELEEPYIEAARRDIGPEETFDVPGGHYFVLGDNRSQSCDSRVFGFVPDANLIGKVVLTYWPPGRISLRLTGDPLARISGRGNILEGVRFAAAVVATAHSRLVRSPFASMSRPSRPLPFR